MSRRTKNSAGDGSGKYSECNYFHSSEITNVCASIQDSRREINRRFLFDSRRLPTAESVSVISSEMHEKEKEREDLKQCKNSIKHIAFQPFLVNYTILSIYSQTLWLKKLQLNTSSFVLIGEWKYDIDSWISIEFWQSSTCLHGPGYQIGRRGRSELPTIQRPNQVLQSNLASWRRFWQWT